MSSSRFRQACAIGGAALVVALFGATSASAAAPVIKPSPTCKVPVFSISKTSALPGTKVTVSGVNFSGCSAQGNPAKPTTVLTVKVGVATAAKVTEILATTKTTASGSFSVTIIVPKVPAGGAPKIALAAESVDPVTKLSYAGIAAITYSVAGTPTAAPTSVSATPPSSQSTPLSSSSPVDVPTAVPAGTGGFGAPTSPGHLAAEIALGGAGLVLVGGSGLALARRRTRQQH